MQAYLPQCLESCLNQTEKSIQIIAVDDCSPDNCRQIIQEYSEKDSRVIGVYPKSNGGPGISRQRGMELATGEWLYFLDGDDFLSHDTISGLLETQKRTNADFVCGNFRHFSEDGMKMPRVEYSGKGVHMIEVTNDLREVYRHQGFLSNSQGRLYRRDMLMKSEVRFDNVLRYGEDTLYFTELMLRLRPHIAIDYDHDGYCYRQRTSSIMHDTTLESRLNQLSRLIEKTDELSRDLGYARILTARKSAEYIWTIKKFSKNRCEARNNLQALRESKFFGEILQPVLCQYGKFKHRLLIKLISKGFYGAIRFW